MTTNHKTLPGLSRKMELSVGGESITVSEITWHAMMDLLTKLGKHTGEFMKDGKFQFSLDRVVELIMKTDELATSLACVSTGRDGEWFTKLSFGDAMDVLDAALEVNLSDHVTGKAKKVGGRLRDLLGIKAAKANLQPIAQSPAFSDSSSGKVSA